MNGAERNGGLLVSRMNRGLLLSLMLSLPGAALAGTPALPTGVYDYAARDTGGAVVATGRLLVESSDSGTWKIDRVASSKDVGPQTGSGTLSIQVSGDEIYIDLDPGWADHNVVLKGTFAHGSLRGDWEWLTYAGIAKSGKFSAVLRRAHDADAKPGHD